MKKKKHPVSTTKKVLIGNWVGTRVKTELREKESLTQREEDGGQWQRRDKQG